MTRVLWLFLVAGCATSRHATRDAPTLDGTWVPTHQELAGQPLPTAAFAQQRLTLRGEGYTLVAESVDRGRVTYADGRLDLLGIEGVNAGKHFMAIYKLDGDQLTVCYDLAGAAYPEVFDTQGQPTYFLSVFKRQRGR